MPNSFFVECGGGLIYAQLRTCNSVLLEVNCVHNIFVIDIVSTREAAFVSCESIEFRSMESIARGAWPLDQCGLLKMIAKYPDEDFGGAGVDGREFRDVEGG